MFKKDKDKLEKLLIDNGNTNTKLADEILVLLGVKNSIELGCNDKNGNVIGCINKNIPKDCVGCSYYF